MYRTTIQKVEQTPAGITLTVRTKHDDGPPDSSVLERIDLEEGLKPTEVEAKLTAIAAKHANGHLLVDTLRKWSVEGREFTSVVATPAPVETTAPKRIFSRNK